jgi:hypothetical protein
MSAPSVPLIVPRPRPTTTSIQFYWEPPATGAPITKYTLASVSPAYSQDISANVATYTVTGLSAGTDYTFTLTATNANGTSDPATFRTVQVGTTTFGPQYATVSTMNTSTALVTWNLSTIAAAGRTEWIMIRAFPSTTAMSSFVVTEEPSNFSTVVEGLSTNTYYQFLVQAINDIGYCQPFAYTSTVGFGIVGASFSPSSLTNLGLWVDATQITGYSNGQGLTSWVESSSNARSNAAVSGPTYQTNVLNSQPVVRFNGSSQYVNFGNYLNMGTEGISIFAVASYSNPSGTPYIVSKAVYGPGLGRWGLGHGYANSNSLLVTNTSSTGTTYEITYADTATGARVHSGIWNRSTLSLYSNATLMATTSAIDTGTASNSFSLYVGAYGNTAGNGPQTSGPNLLMNGDIAEVAVYATALPPFQRQTVEGYLAWKWGLQASLPALHPFKAAAPTATGVFSPSSFSGLQVWLDANDPSGTGVTPSNGTSITTWVDKSGNGRNAISVSTAATVVTNALNSKAVLNTTGTSRYDITYGSIPASYSAFAVYTITSNDGFFQRVIHGGNDYTLFLGVQGGQNVATFVGTGSTWNDVTANSPTVSAFNNWRVVDMINNSSSSQLTPFTDGSAQTAKTGSATSFSNLTLMSHTNNADLQRLKGRLAEVLFYTGVLSADQRQTVEGYLAWKWGLQGRLPTTHPYYKIGPAASNGTPQIDFVADFPSAIGTVTSNFPSYTGSNYEYSITLNGTANAWSTRGDAPILYKPISATSNWTLEAEIQVGPSGIPNNFVGGLTVYPNTDGSTIPIHVGWTYWSGNKPTFEATGAVGTYGSGSSDTSKAFASAPTVGTDYVGIRLIKSGNVFNGQYKFPLNGSWSNLTSGSFTWTTLPSTIRVGLLAKSGTSSTYVVKFRNVTMT